MAFRLTRRIIKTSMRKLGYEIVPKSPTGNGASFDPLVDIDDATKDLFKYVQSNTLSGIERVAALRQAVEYIVRSDIPGDVVECGVWKGGSMMAIARTLLDKKSVSRRLYLFDTFSGMSDPTEIDKNLRGETASQLLDATSDDKHSANVWAIAPLEAVKRSMQDTGYDEDRIVYVRGRVEDTIPAQAPAKIALLRLDTDWYASTYHELVHLFPRLSVGGVLLIDDYGHWQGARLAVDQYMAERKLRLCLNRVDYTGRICIKLDP